MESLDDKLAAVEAMDPEATERNPEAAEAASPDGLSRPGRPACPLLIAAQSVPRRDLSRREGRAALIHSLCHIEFNAINLALDAVWRFRGMPAAYYRDWTRVAREEACHFRLLREHLLGLGKDYGDFPAHDGLWDIAERTRNDLLARMALVPRTLEARGLDASPLIRNKLAQAGDLQGAGILDIILRDEIGHVAIGNHWYRWLCAQQGLEPLEAFERLRQLHQGPRLKGPFNFEARRQAGFTEAELQAL